MVVIYFMWIIYQFVIDIILALFGHFIWLRVHFIEDYQSKQSLDNSNDYYWALTQITRISYFIIIVRIKSILVPLVAFLFGGALQG